MATPAVLIPSLTFKSWLPNGQPNAGGSLQSYQAGTTTPIATWTDSTAVTQNQNPITLNPRGEANVYLLPNVGYKFVESDSLGNQIKITDQVFNSQLLTLYGGVDSGSTNAYVLNFTASFSSYVDGTVLYWTPSHTNTGASTINVNGLGIINITNADGSAVSAGAIVQNQPATILIKGGAALLVSATTTVYGTFTPTWTGFSAPPATTPIAYRKNGTNVTLVFNPVNGTSNATSFIISGLPPLITPTISAAQSYPVVGLLDNGSRVSGGLAAVSSGGTITLYKDGTQPNWTASGSKGFADFVGLTYSI